MRRTLLRRIGKILSDLPAGGTTILWRIVGVPAGIFHLFKIFRLCSFPGDWGEGNKQHVLMNRIWFSENIKTATTAEMSKARKGFSESLSGHMAGATTKWQGGAELEGTLEIIYSELQDLQHRIWLQHPWQMTVKWTVSWASLFYSGTSG